VKARADARAADIAHEIQTAGITSVRDIAAALNVRGVGARPARCRLDGRSRDCTGATGRGHPTGPPTRVLAEAPAAPRLNRKK
jgi:hypothetical protein